MTDLDRMPNYRIDVGPSTPFVQTNDRHWDWAASLGGLRVTPQNGLPLTMAGAVPVIPAIAADRSIQLKVKRVLDVVACSIALVVLLPLLLICAALIKLTSKGPVFFQQQREGLNGEPFQVLKFRSMHVDAGDATGVAQTVKDDPRVFGFGRFLRNTSIDELPQLINVLKGDMSLVGPRPHVPGMRAGGMSYRELVPYYDQRLLVLPGLTGWAQANGLRGPTDNPVRAKARVDHDIAYVCNFSVWLDIKIIFMTIRREFVSGSGN